MRRWVLVVVAVSATAHAKPPRGARPPRAPAAAPAPASEGPGQVTFVTATTAYLDRGLVDGLAVGSALTVTRAGRLAGRCTIVAISERWATCTAQGLKIGDRIAVKRELPPPPRAPAAVPGGAELQLRQQRMEAVPVPLVDFAGVSGRLFGRDTRLASIAASHTTWINLAPADGLYNVQRIDLGVYDVPIWRGLHGSADLTVLNFSQRPASFRSQLGSPVLLVRQLELSFHTPNLPLIAQLGRTWTRYTPGLLMVDGAQAAWRNRDDTVEVGAFGGMLPDAASLGLSTRRWTVGAFVMGRFESGKGPKSSLLQLEARAGYSVRAIVPGRFELGAAAHAWITRSFDAHLQLEIGAGGAMAAGAVDRARFDFGWRPVEAVRIHAGGRYEGAVAADTLELGGRVPGGERSVHADLGVTVELSPSLWIGASTGVASDLGSGLSQTRFGPELTLPGLFGNTAALAIGYEEELGWMRGRNAWLQLTWVPVSRLRILARGSWFQQQLVPPSRGIAGHEGGAALKLDLAITRWLSVGVSALGRGQPGTVDPNPGFPLAGSVTGQLAGQL